MASEIPIREPVPGFPAGLSMLQRAMFKYYSVLCRMPHMHNTTVLQPPEKGWSDIDVETLQARGKTPKSIEFLSHLPRLVESSDAHPYKGPVISPGAALVAFEKGRTGNAWVDRTLPTPNHVIWLADATTRDGTHLLLDTENVTVTEWAPISGRSMLPYQELQALPLSDRWMAHPTLPAHNWFSREQHRIETLLYIPVPSVAGDEPDWYFRAEYFREEGQADDADSADPDYVYESGQSEDTFEGEGGVDSSGDDGGGEDGDDLVIPQDEVDDLVRDLLPISGQQEHHSSTATSNPVMSSNQATTGAQPSTSHSSAGPSPYIMDEVQKRMITDTRAVHQIYLRNGWPSATFNVDKCSDELLQWAEEKRAARVKRDEAQAEDRQQRTLEKLERRKKLIAERAAAAEAAS